MASVSQVYEGVRDLVNKEQKGFITPSVFNSFAQAAQTNIFNSLMNDMISGKKLAKQGVDVGEGVSFRERKREDLNHFITTQVYEEGSGVIPLPDKCAKVISILDRDGSYDEYVDEEENTVPAFDDVMDADFFYEILYDPSVLKNVLHSHLSAPTEGYKIAHVADRIYLYPNDTGGVIVTYYSPVLSKGLADGAIYKTSPLFFVNNVAGYEVINPENSRDFILPEHYVPELIYEIAYMCGVRLRDQEIIAYTQQKLASEI